MSDALVVVDAGGANLASVCGAFARLGIEATLTTDAARIACARRVVLPGVGSAARVTQRLRELALERVLAALAQPLLGICVGMQVLFDSCEEGDVAGLGLVPGRVRRMRGAPGVRVPHMGWNRIDAAAACPLLDGLAPDAHAYFVHGDAADPGPHATSTAVHGERFAASVRCGNRYGVQFHPERSGATGARVLANFIALS